MIAVLMLLGALQGPPLPAPGFVNITEQSLGDVQVVCGGPDKDWIIEVNGGGLGLEDLNGDGHLDLVVVEGSTVDALRSGKAGRAPRLFLGTGDGKFEPAPKAWHMQPMGWGNGLAIGDVDGDGWSDLCLTGLDELVLYRNRAGQGFERMANSGLAQAGWFTSAGFFDADQDGHLDLFVARYLSFDLETIVGRTKGNARWKGQQVMSGPEGMHAQGDVLYRGLGNGRFVEQTKIAGIEAAPAAFGLGVVCRDLDGDGDTDIYVSGDSTPNHVWINRGNGHFDERGFAMGLSHGPNGREQAGMGIAIADMHGAGSPSILVTNFSGENNAFYQPSRRPGRFRDRGGRAGLAMPSRTWLGWGTGFMDWNRDGLLDLWVLNGHVYPQADETGTDTSYAQPDQLFVQGADGRFSPQELQSGSGHVSRTGVSGDIDGDGDEDLVFWTMEGRLQVLRNDCPKQGEWVGLDLRRNTGGSAAIGAQVQVRSGEHKQWAQVQRSAGFQASRPARLLFGLGDFEGAVQVRVTWPKPWSGVQEFEVAAGAWHKLVRQTD